MFRQHDKEEGTWEQQIYVFITKHFKISFYLLRIPFPCQKVTEAQKGIDLRDL